MIRRVSFIIALAMLVISSNAKGQLIQATLGEGNIYRQSSTGVEAITGYEVSPYAFMQSASNFNGGTVTGPPGPYIPMTLVQPTSDPLELVTNVFPTGFSTPTALNAEFPFGTYQLTATNSVTGATESVNINYTQNYFSSTPPQLTPASYAGLQDLNAGSAFDLQFNSFTPTPGATSSFTDVEISVPASGALVFSSLGSLAPSTTALVLPAGRLAAGTTYNLVLASVELSFMSESPTGTGSGLPAVNTGIYETLDTDVTFTTAAGPTPPQTLIVAGGTPANPVVLPPGLTGSVSSPIGGDGASDFYGFYWSGGAFDATASIAGANSSGSYEFELSYLGGVSIDDLVLDAADGFTATINETLLEGLYEIGIIANSPFDPEFTIDFTTPVEGVPASSVPEPATLPLLAYALFMLFFWSE
jgi:hypothetical protein